MKIANKRAVPRQRPRQIHLAKWQQQAAMRLGQLKRPGTYLIRLEVMGNGRRILYVTDKPEELAHE